MEEEVGPLAVFTQTGELFSLMLVLLSFAIATILALRARSLGGFQFEMFIWVLVLFLSEIPKILGTLGLVNLEAFADAGMVMHSISMVFLSSFVGIRTYKFLKGRP